CGKFNAAVRLSGEQPITRMLIIRENSNGGRFLTPLALNVKISFTPVGRTTNEVFEIPLQVCFPAHAIVWANQPNRPTAQVAGFVRVDTDGDGRADTFLPGTSNFFPGQRSRPVVRGKGTLAAEADVDFLVCPDTSEQSSHGVAPPPAETE